MARMENLSSESQAPAQKLPDWYFRRDYPSTPPTNGTLPQTKIDWTQSQVRKAEIFSLLEILREDPGL